MITLNIIPENQKKEIRMSRLYELLKNFFSVIFVILIAYIILFLIFKIILASQFVITVNETAISSRNTENYSREVIEINNRIESAKTIQKDYINWSTILDFIRENQDSEINIESIMIDKAKKTLTLGGLAITRDALLVFKEKLEKSEYFEKIDLPIANLLKKENISLDIKLSFKNYDFKKSK